MIEREIEKLQVFSCIFLKTTLLSSHFTWNNKSYSTIWKHEASLFLGFAILYEIQFYLFIKAQKERGSYSLLAGHVIDIFLKITAVKCTLCVIYQKYTVSIYPYEICVHVWIYAMFGSKYILNLAIAMHIYVHMYNKMLIFNMYITH